MSSGDMPATTIFFASARASEQRARNNVARVRIKFTDSLHRWRSPCLQPADHLLLVRWMRLPTRHSMRTTWDWNDFAYSSRFAHLLAHLHGLLKRHEPIRSSVDEQKRRHIFVNVLHGRKT